MLTWELEAACRHLSPEQRQWFFSYLPSEYNKAKTICAGCPVVDICESEMWDSFQVAGGKTRIERLMDRWQRIEYPGESHFA